MESQIFSEVVLGVKSLRTTGLDDLTSLYNSSFPIEENEENCSSGDL